MHFPLLADIVIVTGLGILVVCVCHRLRIPSIVGFLLTGALTGPYGFGVIGVTEDVELLAELGVIALLFTIGLEFSLGRLWHVKQALLYGGAGQVALTVVAVALIVWQLGLAGNQAVFVGFLISLSSTALVLSLIQQRAEVDSPHGRTILAILIFQDIIVVAMMMFTPLLAGGSAGLAGTIAIFALKAVAVVAVVLVAARWVAPAILHRVTRVRDRELFLFTIVFMALGIAWLTSSLGLSLALGAFLAGLIISESEYSHRALGSIMPFRDVFTSFFFVSVGMLLDGRALLAEPALTVSLTGGVMILKTLLAAAAALLLGLPLRTAMIVGLSLCQIGEFSFVLYQAGATSGLVSEGMRQLFLGVSVLSMLATPLLIALAPRIAETALRLPLPRRLRGEPPADEVAELTGDIDAHLIIIGFGFNGRNLARAARIAGIPYLAIEMNPDTVVRERRNGVNIIYGDAAQEAVLEHARIERARVVVIAISDAAATRRIVELVRRMNPAAYIIARTRFVAELPALRELGADEVIPEEFETSVEIFTRVLAKYLVPQSEIERFIAQVRADGYEMLRSPLGPPRSLADLELRSQDAEIATVRLCPDSALKGQSLGEAQLRQRYGVTLLVIRRGDKQIANPGPETCLQAGDALVVLGAPEAVAALSNACQLPLQNE